MVFSYPILTLLSSFISPLSYPWRFFNLVFSFMIIGADAQTIPATWLFIVIIALLALFAPALFAQVPFYPTSSFIVQAIAQQLPHDRPFSFIDLGCGFGEPLFSLARRFPLGTFSGIDMSPSTTAVAWIRSLWYPNTSIRFKNLWSMPVDTYDYIYVFLAPPPMQQLGEKVRSESKNGAILLSNSFEVPDWSGVEIATGDPRQHTLFIYRCRS